MADGYSVYNGDASLATSPVQVWIQNDGYTITSANSFAQPLQTLANNAAKATDGYNNLKDGYTSFRAILIDGIGGQPSASILDGYLDAQYAKVHNNLQVSNHIDANTVEATSLTADSFVVTETLFVNQSNVGTSTPTAAPSSLNTGYKAMLPVAMASVSATGVLTWGMNISAISGSSGAYVVTLMTGGANANHLICQATVNNAGGDYTILANPTSGTAISIYTHTAGGGAVDVKFFLTVWAY